MSEMFRNNYIFNQDISSWDVSNVSSFYRMFFRAQSFNQNLADWDLLSATDL